MNARNVTHVEIESSLPRPWEREESFHDALYDWLQRAPWLLLSLAAHGVVFFILQAVPWNLFEEPEETVISATIEVPAPELPDDPPDELPEVIETVDPTDEVLLDPLPADVPEDSLFADDLVAETGDPDAIADSPLESMNANMLIGAGSGAGAKYGGRFGQGKGKGGGGGVNIVLEAGLNWLAKHQAPNGAWNVDEFMHDRIELETACDCQGPGQANQDVGITGLSLLAFLGAGNTTRDGPYRETVQRGVRWLMDQQDSESGLVGEDIGHSFVYDHAIATLALSEAYYFSGSPTLEHSVRKAIRFIEKGRNPYGAWRYDVPPLGENDTSITAWMVLALASAKDGGVQVDREALTGALNWIDEVTDPANGRVGYDAIGSVSSRVPGLNDHFPANTGESMTAAGLLCRFFLGQHPGENQVMKQHADLLLQHLPEWDPAGLGCDMYYWYYGSYAMYQMGGKHWDKWNKAMKEAVVHSQRNDGHYKGSWDPVGPWGFSGGRVYSTAMMVLCLEVYFRYSRVIGGR